MTGIFAEWQPQYAERGLATFPVRDKRPVVKGYLKVGMAASNELALKFANDDSFGLSCSRSHLTILDVDAPNERLLADALSEFGPTPFIVRSGSGNFQAWYRNNGEGRQIRPDAARPVDILGNGFVVAPPSKGAKVPYCIIDGTLDDLCRLPVMRKAATLVRSSSELPQTSVGKRNNDLWRGCMKAARDCDDIDQLIRLAVEMNHALVKPLPDEEVLRIVDSAWAKEQKGENWFGRGGRLVVKHSEVDGLLSECPDAFILLTILRRRHWGHAGFQVPNDMADNMPKTGWSRQRFACARTALIKADKLFEVRAPSSYHGAGIYRFKGVE